VVIVAEGLKNATAPRSSMNRPGSMLLAIKNLPAREKYTCDQLSKGLKPIRRSRNYARKQNLCAGN